MDIIVKKMETEAEIRGKAWVHWSTWHEAFLGLVSPDFLRQLTLARCEKMAFSRTDGLLVAKDGDRVVGFVGYGTREEAPEAGEIFSLYVLSRYQGRGVGRQLMAAALRELAPYRQIVLWVLKKNTRAIRFYEKCGFAATGETMYSERCAATEIRMALERPEGQTAAPAPRFTP